MKNGQKLLTLVLDSVCESIKVPQLRNVLFSTTAFLHGSVGEMIEPPIADGTADSRILIVRHAESAANAAGRSDEAAPRR